MVLVLMVVVVSVDWIGLRLGLGLRVMVRIVDMVIIMVVMAVVFREGFGGSRVTVRLSVT